MNLHTIWGVMKAMYPHSFKEYGPVDGPVFRYWLADLDGADLVRGHMALRARTNDFPPNLPEFRKMCGALMELPENDEEMRRYAIAEGYGDAQPGESWPQYRARIKSVLERQTTNNLKQLTGRTT